MPAIPLSCNIILFAGNFAPRDWAFCDGQLLPISEYDALFNLIGTTYGGDGQTTFALPDLRGRVPLHRGTSSSGSYVIGEQGGTESVTLTSQQMPSHTHVPLASRGGTASTTPTGNVLSAGAVTMYTRSTSAPVAMTNPGALLTAGGNLPHENMQPFQCLNYIIALYGVFPSQN